MSPLSTLQKSTLAQAFRRGFALHLRASATSADNPSFDQWRHEQVMAAVGKPGLRCCDQNDYCALMAHTCTLIGDEGDALNWHLRGHDEPLRQARAILKRELATASLSPNYAEAICKNEYGCPVGDANKTQLWRLIYTIRNRAKSRKAKGDRSGSSVRSVPSVPETCPSENIPF